MTGAGTGPTDHAGEPLANTAVVEAMHAVAVADTTESRALLYRLLLETTLLAVTPDRPAVEGPTTLEGGGPVQLVVLSEPDGPVLPLFTSPEAITRWRPAGAGYLAVPARSVFEMAVANGTARIVIDHGSPTGGTITRPEIEQLARGRLPLGGEEVVADPTQINIGRPAVPPSDGALDAVRAQLEAEPEVARAWYYLMQQGTQAPELVIAVRFAPGTDAGAVPLVMRRVVDGSGRRSPDVAALLFNVVDDALADSMERGFGVEFFTRS